MQGQAITRFSDEYRWLSNFWPVDIEYEGKHYTSVENAYQASKTINEPIRYKLTTCSPAQAKRTGRLLVLRDDWSDDLKISIMKDLIRKKFHRSDLAEKLLSTGDSDIVEGNNWYDTFWGQCPLGTGSNHLGIIIMDIRKELHAKVLS